MPEGEEEEQKVEHLFEQIMKENFPSLAKEIDFQELQEAHWAHRELPETKGNYNKLTANYINMKKEIETINKGQEEMKNTISELKNTVEGMKNRLDEAEDQISELEDR